MINRLLKVALVLAVLCGSQYVGWLSGAHAATIQLPRTGQTVCYNAAGGVIACAGTGQDGEKQMGVALPAPRFTDNANGTVTDNLTGLIWLQNANCFGAQVWATALTSANTLVGNSTQCGLNDGSVAGDWRLPNRTELLSLIDWQNASIPSLPASHPFSNVQVSYYWSSSSYAISTNYAWIVSMISGFSDKGTTNSYVWPVRAGQLGNSIISTSPASNDFGSITATTTSAAQTFTISNSGSALMVSDISTTGGDSGMFAIDPGNGTGGTCGSLAPTIALNASCKVSVTFTPTTTGAKSTTLRIASNDPVTPNKDIALTGTGVLPTYTVTPAAGTGSSISPATSQTIGSGAATSFTVNANAGYGVVSVTGCGGALNGTTYTTGAVSGDCSVTVTAVKRNGNNGVSADPAIADALNALQAYSGAVTLTAAEQVRYDVAPLTAGGVPQGNGVVDIADVIMILRRTVGIGNW